MVSPPNEIWWRHWRLVTRLKSEISEYFDFFKVYELKTG